MKTDFLPGIDASYHQDSSLYTMNSDTELLGYFMHVLHKDDVLDIGCGQGALLIYAGMHKPRSLTGIDLFPEVLEQAEKNLQANGMQAELICSRVQDYHEKQFDVIVCNPPYFETEKETLKNDNAYRRAARHAENLPMEELYISADRLLKDNGRFFLVHKAVNLQKLIVLGSEHHMKLARMRLAYDHEDGKAKSVLLEFRKGRCPETVFEEPAYLNDRASMQKYMDFTNSWK